MGKVRATGVRPQAKSRQIISVCPGGPGKLNNYRFERQANGTWRAALEWPAKVDKPAGQKVYIMEPWKP